MPDKKNTPITRKEEISQHPDNKIDEDFKGYPDGPTKDATINPGSRQEEKLADMGKKDGEKRDIKPEDRESLDEQDSDGSANAFDDK